MNSNLKYRKFDQLLGDVMIDFQNYSLENMIEPQTLIKVAKRCNYELGLRVYRTKDVILDVEKGRVRLPDDFYVFNFGLLCGQYSVQSIRPQGLHLEHSDVIPTYKSFPSVIDTCTDGTICNKCTLTVNDCGCPKDDCHPAPSPCTDLVHNPIEPYGDFCVKPRVFVNCKGDCVEIIQKIKAETRTYSRVMPLRLRNNGVKISKDCPNIRMTCADEIEIKDNFLWTSFDCGQVYMSYEGDMEDEDGNLLVPDHELINDFYEYALKERVLENLMYNDENVVNKLNYILPKLRAARNNAMSLVNMPNYAELQDAWRLNRNAMHQKYYAQFQTYNWIHR